MSRQQDRRSPNRQPQSFSVSQEDMQMNMQSIKAGVMQINN